MQNFYNGTPALIQTHNQEYLLSKVITSVANTLDKQVYLNPIIYSNNPDKQMQSTRGCRCYLHSEWLIFYSAIIPRCKHFVSSVLEEGQHFNSTENREHILQTPELNHSHHLILESKVLEYLTKGVRERYIVPDRPCVRRTDIHKNIFIFIYANMRNVVGQHPPFTILRFLAG